MCCIFCHGHVNCEVSAETMCCLVLINTVSMSMFIFSEEFSLSVSSTYRFSIVKETLFLLKCRKEVARKTICVQLFKFWPLGFWSEEVC